MLQCQINCPIKISAFAGMTALFSRYETVSKGGEILKGGIRYLASFKSPRANMEATKCSTSVAQTSQ